LFLFCFLFPLVCAVTKMGAKGWSMEQARGWTLEHAGARFSGFRVDKKTRVDFICVFRHKTRAVYWISLTELCALFTRADYALFVT
jgi:hypothetical protein